MAAATAEHGAVQDTVEEHGPELLVLVCRCVAQAEVVGLL
jgi:hypothetical protein